MKRILISLFVLCALGITSNARDIESIVRTFGEDTTFRYSSSGISVFDIEKGAEIAQYNSSMINVPASTMKTVTFSTALALFGEDFQFSTPIKLVGKQDTSGVFYGDIIIEPGCDPTFGSEHFDATKNIKKAILEKIKNKGITEIRGKIKVLSRDNFTDGMNPNWCADDVAYGYGASSFDFNYADNEFVLPIEVRRGRLIVSSSQPRIPNLKVKNEMTIVSQNSSYGMRTPDIIRGVSSNELILSGTVLPNTGKRWLSCSMYNPSEVFESDFTRFLRNNDIKVSNERNKFTKDTVMLWDYKSPKLKDIAHSALVRSDNMFTHTLLLEIAKKQYGERDRNLGIKAIKKYWEQKGLNIDELLMDDGSGLARKNGVTARFLAKMLAVAQSKGLDRNINFASYLPKFGVEGTVKSLLKGSEYKGKIAMKSGSISRVQCYAGYFPVDNPKYTITIMVNNFTGSRRTLKGKIEDFLLELMPALEPDLLEAE